MRFFLSALIGAVLLGNSVKAETTNFDSLGLQKVLITKINIIGNKTTKRWIIERELSFQIGDSLTGFEMANAFKISKQNLINTSLFNFVDFRFTIDDQQNTEIFIMLSERWYFWPIPIFDLAETNLNSWWENKDFSRINYGVDFRKKNFRGRNEELDLYVQFGFTQLMAVKYSIPYINKKRTIGLSTSLSYGQNHEVNYTSNNNKRLFYKDVYNLQQKTLDAGVTFKYRRKFYSNHLIGLGYHQVEVSDSVLVKNNDYLVNGQNEMSYLSLSYRYIFDRRDNQNYALEGRYVSGTVVKHGLGVSTPNVDLLFLLLEYKQYWKISKRLYPAFMTQFHFYTNELQPYYLRDGLGYTDKSTIRSYELYVIDAQQLGIAKLQLRYQLIASKSYNMGFIPINKFRKLHFSLYVGIFGDVGYGNDRYGYANNYLANSWQYGSGFSIDIASYYDLVLRTEYSMNKFGEHGLFLHFVSPI